MPSFVRVIRRGRNNSRVLLDNGHERLIPNNLIGDVWVQSGTPAAEQTNTPSQTHFTNPENQSDRVYRAVLRRGSRNTRVLLEDNRELVIPNEFMGSWLATNSDEYFVWATIERRGGNPYTIRDCTFGVELEFVANPDKLQDFCDAMRDALGAQHFTAPLCYGRSSTRAWSLQTDSSVRPTQANPGYYRGYELTSPILKFDDSSKQELITVLNLIVTVFEGKVNRTCGTHIHIGGFTPRPSSQRELARQYRQSYGSMEYQVFDRLVSNSRRSNNNQYCRSCNTSNISSRYHKINLENFTNSGFGTIENRQHQGTLEYQKIWYWMELNSKFILKYFYDSDFRESGLGTLSMIDFFDKIGLSEDAKSFFIEREQELN